jgi:NADH dehydrogenase
MEFSSELVLVTGASGFIGKTVVPYLLKQGYRVRAFIRPTSSWPFASHPHLEKAMGDMQDPASLSRALMGVHWVVHLAAAKSDEPDSELTNIGGAQNLIQACRANHVRFIINLSTQSAKLKNKGTYARTKEVADRIFHESDLSVTTLRSSLVYGRPISGAFGKLVQYSELPIVPVIGPGTAPMWPIHVEDLAHALYLAAIKPQTRGQIYEVGGPDRISLNELLDLILKWRGRHRPKWHIPVWAGLILASLFSLLPKPPFSRSNVLGTNEEIPMDVERFFQDFGFVPRRLVLH